MANDKKIKGIILQIGGDTSELGKALKTADEQVKKSVSEIKQIDTALKKAPESAVLWTQKQELLTKALQDSKDKLKDLESAQDEMKKKFDSGEIGAEAYRNFQREVEYAKADVEKFEGQLKTANDKLESLSDATQGAGEGFSELSGETNKANDSLEKTGDISDDTQGKLDKLAVIGAAAGAALATGAKKAYDAWEEVDEGYDTIIQKTGASGEALQKMQDIADEIFTSMPVDMADAGTAVGEVNTRFGAVDDTLKTLTEDFLVYAKLNGTNVNSSIDNVSATMKAFGEETENAGKILDVLTTVGQQTGIDLGSLESILVSNSATFKEMDLSIAESAQLLGQFELNGVDTSTALAGLKKAQQNATAEGKSLSTALKENIDAIKTSKTETEALQIATDLFGKKGAAALTQAIRESRFSVEDLNADLDTFAGTTKKTFEATLDAPDKLKVTLNNLKKEGADLAEKVLPKVEKGADFLVKNLPKIESTLKKSLPLVEGVAAGFVAWKAAEKIGGIVTSIKNMATALKSGETAMSALNATMDANPYLLVGGAILGIGVAVKEYLDDVEPFKTETQKAIDKIEKETEAIIENKNAYQEKKDEAYKAVEADLAQTNQAEALWHELDTLADSTGKVKDKDKDRANFILNELNNALGTEYTMTGNQIEQYDKLKESIEEVIKQKRANILLTAAEAGYTEAVTNKTDLEMQQVENQKAINETERKINNMLYGAERLRTVSGKILNLYDIRQAMAKGEMYNFQGEYNESKWIELTDLVRMLDEEQKKYDENEEFLRSYYGDIDSYENASTQILKGNYDEAVKILDKKGKAFIKTTDILEKDAAEQKKILENQLKDYEMQYQQTLQRHKEGVAGITQDTINAAKRMRDDAEKELKAFEENSFNASVNNINGVVNNTVSGVAKMRGGVEQELNNFKDASKRTFEEIGANAGTWSSVAMRNASVVIADQLATNVAKISNVFAGILGAQSEMSVAEAATKQVVDRIKILPFMAKGGTLKEGQAIVAEAGPELLQIINGEAKVTPLNKSATNTAVGNNETTIVNNYNTFNVKSLDNPQDIYKISEQLGRLQTSQRRAKGK